MSTPGTSEEVVSAIHRDSLQEDLSVLNDGGVGPRRRDHYWMQPPPPFTEIDNNRSPLHDTHGQGSALPQPHPTVVVQQQPMRSVSAIHSCDPHAMPAEGLEAVETAARAAAAAAGLMREWMPKPLVSRSCPPGLEYLTVLSELVFFDQMMEFPLGEDYRRLLMQGRVGDRLLPRRFQVINSTGQQVYWATMNFSSVPSYFETVFVDRTGQEVMAVKMKQVCCPTGWCCLPCSSCVLEATVEAPPGYTVGSVTQRYSGRGASFIVNGIDGSSFRLKESSPCFCYYCCGGGCCDAENIPLMLHGEFAIYSLDSEDVIGKIKTQQTLITPYSWRLLTNFALSFPADLDVTMKATLTGAATMLHYYFYGSALLQLEVKARNKGFLH